MLNAAIVGITLMIIMGLSLLFYTIVKVTPEESFASAIMMILVLIYVTGMIGDTKIAIAIVCMAALCGMVVSVFAMYKKSKNSIKSFWSPGILMVCGITVVGMAAFDGMLIYNWDELYQWAKAADYMVMYDRLPNGADFSGEPILLSSTTFFHYFIARLSAGIMGEITPSNYYVSNLLLWFSALLLPFSGEGWKSWKRVWSFGIFQFLLATLIFIQPYYNIYTDQATAYWAGGLIAWLLERKCTRKNIYLIPLIMINVGLMKSMVGPLFCVIDILAIVVLYCIDKKEIGSSIKIKNWKKYVFSKRGILGTVLIITPIIFMLVWSVVVGKNGLFRFSEEVLKSEHTDRLALTIKAMIGELFTSVNMKNDSFYLSYAGYFLIVLGIVYVIYPLILKKAENNRYQKLMSMYIVGFFVYFLIMLVAYMFVFEYNDSINATSLNRYFSDYMMLGVVPLTVTLFKKNQNENTTVKLLKKGLILGMTLFIVYGTSGYVLPRFAHVYAVDIKQYAERERFVKYAKKAKELTREEGKIYFINQKESGLFTLVADYEMGSQLTRGGMCYKFRKDTSKKIGGLIDYDIETFPSILYEHGYSYVWVYSTNNYFSENMNKLFSIKDVDNGDFYQVVVTERGVELQYLDNIQ